MASSELTLEKIYSFFKENGCKVKNRDTVRHFKRYLTDPQTKDENRVKFKQYVNMLAHTKTEGDEKLLILKTKYLHSLEQPQSPSHPLASLQFDSRNSVGLPLSPSNLPADYSPARRSSTPRQPPPYRPPPPPVSHSPSPSLDNISLGSNLSLQESTPQPPPRKRDVESSKSIDEDCIPKKGGAEDNGDEKQTISVKERTQKFNRMASVEDELSPRAPKSSEKDRSRASRGVDDEDGASTTPLEPKKCVEWYVTASKGDFQELLKLAKSEPRLVNKKDPFTAYTVLHWGAKYGNAEIIKIFAGKYKVDVNGKTNGGYTPLHISAQFGHKDLFKLLIEVYKADTKIRDYSGRTPEFYLLEKELQKENSGITLRKLKGRKKQSEKDLGFLRIGSLNVRVKKTTEAFSNFLGVGIGTVTSPVDAFSEKMHKGWGSADNVSKDTVMGAPKTYAGKKKSKRAYEPGLNSTPTTPKTPTKNFSSSLSNSVNNDSDSDSAAGFDSQWKN